MNQQNKNKKTHNGNAFWNNPQPTSTSLPQTQEENTAANVPTQPSTTDQPKPVDSSTTIPATEFHPVITSDKKSNTLSKKTGIIICVIAAAIVVVVGTVIAIVMANSSTMTANDQSIVTNQVVSHSYNEAATEETTEATVKTTVETISIPDVVGLSQTDAENQLDSVGLSVIVKEGEDDSIPNGYVISQSPLAGKTVNKNESVTIYISKKQTVPTTVSSNNSSSIDNKKYLYCCASDFATLRNRPSRSGSEIVKITTREKVEYLGRDGEFYYVSYKGDKGYVLADFFSEDINAPLNYGTGNL